MRAIYNHDYNTPRPHLVHPKGTLVQRQQVIQIIILNVTLFRNTALKQSKSTGEEVGGDHRKQTPGQDRTRQERTLCSLARDIFL